MDTFPTLLALTLTYGILFVLERAFPLRVPKAPLLRRLGVNAAITITAFAAAALMVRPAAAEALAFTEANSFGLMPILGLSGAAEVIAAFLLMDLTFYYWHRANHWFEMLWRIHNVHHIDPDLDVTTGFRFHFAEVALSAGFRVVQLLLIGPSLLALAVYEIAFQSFTLFHHSNLRLPLKLERVLNRVVVTPRMHGIHHSDYRAETNSNFGVVFPWWDALHRTLNLDVPQASITIGVPAYSHPQDNRLGRCLILPFVYQRSYWRNGGAEHLGRESQAIARPGRLAD